MTRGGSDVTERTQPLVQRRRVRSELRTARQAAGLTQEQVAAEMDWSPSKVIRIENGSVGISTNDVRALLRLYGIADPRRESELVALAKDAREPSWWRQYKDVVGPRFLPVIEYEESASVIKNFEPLLIPGLLQTPEYSRSVLTEFMDKPTKERVDDLIHVRMKRQEKLYRADPPALTIILDEAVVRRVVGTREIMQRQLLHLIDMATRPHVTIEVVPFSVGIHRGMTKPFMLLEFSDPDVDDVLYFEGTAGDPVIKDANGTTKQFHEAFEELRKLALSPAETAKFLGKLAYEMR
jgi:transcriptional regulator with XRE-family HTH domain